MFNHALETLIKYQFSTTSCTNVFALKPEVLNLFRISYHLAKRLWTSIHHKKLTLSCVLYAYSQFMCSLVKFDPANQGLRQPVQPHTFNAHLLVFDETLAQPYFAVVNCSDVGMSVFHFPVLTRSLIFLQL